MSPSVKTDKSGKSHFIELKKVIGLIFKDEVDLEDYISKISRTEHRLMFNVSVLRPYRNGRNYSSNKEEDEDFDYNERRAIDEAVDNFLFGKQYDSHLKLKELKFIEDIGMTKSVATQLDFEMRRKLEKIFPKLQNYNILCFKKKENTCRRALIFPQEYKYKPFMDTMVSFLTHNNTKYVEALKSKIKINFKGKYILQIEDDMYRNFVDKITRTIQHFGLSFTMKPLIRRREVQIHGSYDKVQAMKECVKEIMGFLFPKPCYFKEDLIIHNYFCLRSKAGQDEIDRLNNKNNGKAFGRFDPRTSKFLLRSDPENRKNYLKLLETW